MNPAQPLAKPADESEGKAAEIKALLIKNPTCAECDQPLVEASSCVNFHLGTIMCKECADILSSLEG